MSRTHATICCFASALLLPGHALAQNAAANYPSRTVQVIVPFAPGAGTDIETRLYSQKLTEALGRPFVVDYKPGAGSTIGGNYVAKSTPDGYTLMSATPSNGIASLLYKNLPYDPIKDFAFISMMSKRPSMLIASNSFPARDVKEYMDYVRKNPGKLNLATSGAGGVAHLSMEWLHHATKTKVTFVHFKGGGPANTAVMAGQVDAVIGSVAAMMNQIKAGKARAIGVTALERIKLLPDVPTVSEQALNGFEYAQWVGMTAPAKTPKAIIDKLAGELARIARDPELAQKFADDATQMIGNTPEQFTAYVLSEAARWKKLIEETGITLEGQI
jgi:tripartite-type tricarboxylate transporter receptor subunit TctC